MVPKEDTDEEKLNVIKRVSQELMDKPKQFQQLLHYSNIVSSYLETTASADDGDGADEDQNNNQNIQVNNSQNQNNNSSTYTSQASKELGSLGSDYEDLGDDLSEKIGIEANEEPDEKTGGVGFNSETINNFLYNEISE